MSYSRRQLEAFGEPLGDSATRKEAGRVIYGGGGSAAPATQTAVSDLPDWAKPYAQDTLAKASAITDPSKNPYQVYGGQRIAQFSPMQQQAFQGAQNMQPSQQGNVASGIAQQAGLGALGSNYQAGQFYGGQFGNRQAAQYMSPFINQALQPQLNELSRQSAIQGQQQQVQATQAGAFGGARDAIQRSERERNLGVLQSNVLNQGYQQAYDQAANQFNQDQARSLQAQQLGEQSRQFGANVGLQGLQTATQAALTLGNLGNQQFQQGMDINKLQSTYGQQQQGLQQQGLDLAYQDFINQQNYPYKQLGYMSDMIRGLPLGQSSTTQMYQAAPSMVSQLAGLGGAGYMASKMFKEGGEVKRDDPPAGLVELAIQKMA